MKNIFNYGYYVLAIATLSITTLIFSGCTMNTEQAKIIANQAGLYSAVTWVAVDNPTNEVKVAVVNVLKMISENTSTVNTNQSYSDVMYPLVMKYLNTKNYPAQYKPLVMVGTSTLLGGIDMLFASNPQWKENATISTALVNSFCTGAINGLSMSETNPMMKSARKTHTMRLMAIQGK